MIRRILFTSLLTIILGLNAFCQSITLSFDQPQVITNGDYVDIHYKDIRNGGQPGSPAMPVYGHNILLPQNRELSDVTITSITYHKNSESGTIMPVQKPLPVSEISSQSYFTNPDDTFYGSTRFPQSAITNHHTHFLSGHGIATFNICPVEYHPLAGEILFISSITFEYKTVAAKQSICRASNSKSVITRLNGIVSNPEKRISYSYSDAKNGDADMLFISKAEYLPLLEEYIAYKQSTGFFTLTISTEDIITNYDGLDEQDQIRNCIKHYYENYGIEYVILVGDADPVNEGQNFIPHRGLKAVDDNDIPADMYYSNLDGNWDENGNGVWGQVGEGDLYAEVAIGRFCVDSPGEIANIIHKNIMYQDQPVIDDANKFLLVGENLNNNPLTWGGTYMDELYYGTSNHGFTTAAISDKVETSRLYDRDESWSPRVIRDHFNITGLNFLNHLGHSNVTYNMKMDNQDLTTQLLKNDGIERGYCIGYSQGCYNGSFDNRGTSGNHSAGDSFAEKITTMETAYVAAVANSRYGWYMPSNTNSSSQFYNRYFFDALFGMDITEIGWANAYSKEAETSWLDGEYFRWTAYELNLFGDPSLDIYTAKPEEVLVSIPETIIEGDTDITFKSDAPHARIAVLLNNELITRTFADVNGETTITLPSPAVDGQDYEISVIAHNKLRYTQPLSVTSNTPLIICTKAVVDDNEYNGNGIADYGETVNINLTFKNSGDKACINAIFAAVIDSPMINIINNISAIGTMESGEEITIDNAITLEISPDIAPKDISVLIISDEEKSWSSSFILPVGAVIPVITEFEVTEQSNQPNGRIDAGENAILTYTLTNEGNAPLENLHININPKDIFVNCVDNPQNIELLGAEESVTLSFEITTSEETPNGFTSFIDFTLEADRGKQFSEEHYTFIGLPRVLVCDLDNNMNSAPVMVEDLKSVGASAEYYNYLPENISDYDAIFLTLGVFPYAHNVTQEEGQLFADYLNSGKKMYIESGSFWYFNNHTPLHDMMNIDSYIGNGWVYGNENLVGMEGTFGEGMEFGYTGDNKHIDHLEVSEPTQLIFTSEPNTFGAMATHQGDNYKAIATTFEWGGLNPSNAASSRQLLMEKIIDYLELNTARPQNISLGRDTTICLNKHITLDAGDDFVDYLWSNGATSQTIVVDTTNFKENINYISVSVITAEGYTASDEIIVTFDACIGVDEANISTLSVYPNPATDFLTIEFPGNNFTVTMIDITGKIIQSSFNNQNKTTLNTNGLHSGVYILRLETDGNVTQKRVIIK